MEFGLDQCTASVFNHGRVTKSQNISLNNQTIIRNMTLDETCKYSGHKRRWRYWQQRNEGKLVKEYYCQVRQMLRTELNLKNSFIDINTLAVPVSVYSFGVVIWLKINWEDRLKKWESFQLLKESTTRRPTLIDCTSWDAMVDVD